jgi:agmatine deiminase
VKNFSDLDTNVVYFSEFFKLRFPNVYEPSRVNLEANGIKVRLIKGNQNIWCRDYMPAQVMRPHEDPHFIRFGYKGYSSDGLASGYKDYPWLIVPEKSFRGLKIDASMLASPIILDGGGIVRSRKHAVITEKVFLDNPGQSRGDILSTLQGILNLDVIIVPSEPGDTLGHTDGICKFIDDKNILVNDYSSMGEGPWDEYSKKLLWILQKAGLSVKLMPYAYELCEQLHEEKFREKHPFADDKNEAAGYYINFLLTKTCILLPVFGIDQDQAAVEVLKMWYPQHSVVAIDCKELAMEGGLSNCTTWNIVE